MSRLLFFYLMYVLRVVLGSKHFLISFFRIIQNRILLVVLSIVMVVVIGVAIYFATKKS